jgi:hypothetical protein
MRKSAGLRCRRPTTEDGRHEAVRDHDPGAPGSGGVEGRLVLELRVVGGAVVVSVEAWKEVQQRQKK